MKYLLIIFSLLFYQGLFAQNSDSSSFNIQSYTPSVLLKKQQWEYKFFNNLYTQRANYDAKSIRNNSSSRGNYFTSINQFLYGLSRTINIGADVWVKSVRIDASSSSPLKLFKFAGAPSSRTSLGYIGPKIKIAPFKQLDHLSIQSTFLIPIAKDMEGSASIAGSKNDRPFLESDRYLWITQFFYDQPLGNNFNLFFQFAPWVSIDRSLEKGGSNLATPTSVFFSYFAGSRLTLYAQSEIWPTYGSKKLISSFFVQSGLGVKFQAIPGLLEMEALYTNFWIGKNSGAGQTFNFGIRLIH